MANVEYFLKIDGIPGESDDTRHPGEIAVAGWSFGESETGAAPGGASAGKVKFRDFHFGAAVSKASPRLIEACAEGRHIPSAVLTCRKSGGFQAEFLVLKFSDVTISSYGTGAAAASEAPPADRVSLSFAKVEVDYTEQKPDGSTAPPIQVTV